MFQRLTPDRSGSLIQPSPRLGANPLAHGSVLSAPRLGADVRRRLATLPGVHSVTDSEQQASSIFPRTDWAELGRAADGDEVRLDRLIRLYWAPLRVFLVASFPALRDEAEVVLQDFAEDKILKKGWLSRADRTRGKFRHYLKTSLRNFALDRLNGAEAKRRHISLDELEHELPEADAPSEEFDLTWVRTVLAETLRRMEADCKNAAGDQPRRGHIWEMFRIRLLAPIFDDVAPVPYEQLIERFGLKSPTDASNMLLSAKRIFKMHLTKVIGDYAGQDAATMAEIQALQEILLRIAK